MQGWIKIHRKITEWEWYSDHNTTRLFLHLLLLCNHKTTKWRGFEVQEGEVLTGRKKLSEQTGLSEQQIRTSLNKLKSTNSLTIKTTKLFSIIKLNNWNHHQQLNQQTTTQATNEQPTSNHIQECKNEKNEKKINIHTEFLTSNKKAKLILTMKEYEKLKEQWSEEEIQETIESIQNYRKNYNYVSLNSTIRKWLKKEKKSSAEKKESNLPPII